MQVDKPGDTEHNGGFRSKESVTDTFQYAFTTPGTYYYIAGGFGHIGEPRVGCMGSGTTRMYEG